MEGSGTGASDELKDQFRMSWLPKAPPFPALKPTYICDPRVPATFTLVDIAGVAGLTEDELK